MQILTRNKIEAGGRENSIGQDKQLSKQQQTISNAVKHG